MRVFPLLSTEDEKESVFSTILAIRENRTLGSSIETLYTRSEIIEIIRRKLEEGFSTSRCFICGRLINPAYKIICDDNKTPKILEKACFCRRHRLELIAPMFNIKAKY